MTYPQIDNRIRFSYPPTLLKFDLCVKSYARFSNGPSNRPNLRTERHTIDGTTDHQSRSLFGPTTTYPGSFGLFPLCLNPNIRRFDPKPSDFSQFKPRNIIQTYLSQIIKSELRKSEEREDNKHKNTSSIMPQTPAVPTLKFKFSMDFITWYVGFH